MFLASYRDTVEEQLVNEVVLQIIESLNVSNSNFQLAIGKLSEQSKRGYHSRKTAMTPDSDPTGQSYLGTGLGAAPEVLKV